MMTSPLNLIPASPERRPYRLKCRFVIGTAPCHERISRLVPPCSHLERAAYEAGSRFLDDMAKQGWDTVDGGLALTGGPFPMTVLDSSALPAPIPHGQLRRGPHARFGPSYDSPVREQTPIDQTDGWEFELSGWFTRPMLPTEATVSAVRALEAKRKVRHG